MEILANNKERLLVYYPEKETLEVHWLGHVSDLEILRNMEEVTALYYLIHVKKYVVNLLKAKSFNFPYQKHIIEKSLKAFNQQGGEELLIVNKKEAPNKLYKIYKKALKNYGIKLHLESEKVFTRPLLNINL